MGALLKKPLLVLALAIAVVMPFSAFAQTTTGQNTAATADEALQTPAGKFIQDLGNNAIKIIADKSLNQQQREAKYHDILHNAFDLKTIGHFVIGRAYNTATPDQQQEYMKLFEELVVKIYGARLNFYSGENFHVKGVRQESDQDRMVKSEITHSGGAEPTTVDWRVRQQNDGKLAIIDVIVSGVSQSVTQRQEFASIIQRDGGKIDGLLTVMRERIQGTPADNGS
jgi:phospholipid transport system substrate-binding protein